MMRTWKVLALAGALALMIPAAAQAGRGGGSMGGRGGFSSGRSLGGSLGSGGGIGSSPSSGGGRSSFFFFGGSPFLGGYGGGEGCGDPDTMVLVLVIVLGLGGYMAFKTYQARKRLKAGGWDPIGAGPGADEGTAAVLRVSLAFLGTEKALQRDLEALARSGRAGTEQGDALLVREACLLMTRSADAMTRVFFEQQRGLSSEAARARLEEVGMDLRSRYEEESVRSDEGGVRERAAAKQDDVSEVVVVSVVVAYRPPVLAETQLVGSAPVVALLRQIGGLGGERLLGMEISWDPVSPEEALTTKDLDRVYPELLPL
jgi:uncharacterized membrane protein